MISIKYKYVIIVLSYISLYTFGEQTKIKTADKILYPNICWIHQNEIQHTNIEYKVSAFTKSF